MLDNDLQQSVLEQLREEAVVDASQIGVTAKDGVVTLTGFVPSFSQKRAAEEATKRVYGVRGVADEVQVRLPSASERTDAEIAKAALDAVKWHSMVPDDRITVTVDKGWLTLEGTVDWRYQSDAAEAAVRNLTGVRWVSNEIRIKARVSPADVKQKLYDAFRRSAELEARRIGVEASDGKVTLRGNLHDWSEVQEATRAAWSVPGVSEIDNRLTVVP